VRVFALGVLLAVAVIIAAVVLGRGRDHPSAAVDQGPLLDTSLTGIVLNSIPNDAYRPVSIGLDIPRYGGAQELVIDSLDPVRETPGMRVLGYRWLVPAENNGGLEGGDGFPPKGWLVHPLSDARVGDGLESGEILVGVEATEIGFQNVLGFWVNYHIGQKHYTAVVRHSITICAPIEARKTCDSRPGAKYVSANVLTNDLGAFSRRFGYG
jgi:hypothetical protein